MCEVIGAGVVGGSAQIGAGTARLGTARQRTSQLRNMVWLSLINFSRYVVEKRQRENRGVR